MARSESKPRPRRRGRAFRALGRLRASVQNAKDIIELGRLGDPWGSAYEVVVEARHYRLRRYASVHSAGTEEQGDTSGGQRLRAAVLLVPPLMVTSEVYDVAPEISAVASLTGAGLDVWVVDFGAPEREEGGLDRTLDDHVLAVDEAVDHVWEATGHDVHLVGYSQGGMFCYQTAAYRNCRGIASLITFGSPVDIHRNLPAVDAELGGRVIGAARRALAVPLAQIEALPGFLTSIGFKALSLRKELEQIADFLNKLHDREALIKRESRRRFLGGEGFVAWPGPALRTFVDEFIVNNRMSAGGFVIAGRTASLADLDVPILYFVGERDDIARPASVRAIAKAAAQAETYEVALPAGHFGLVVGSTAMAKSWPTVAQWVRWREQAGPRPAALPDPEIARARAEKLRREWDDIEALDVEVEFEPIVDLVGSMAKAVVGRVEDATRELGETFDDLRYQLPRLRTLEQLGPDTLISMGRELADRAAKHPDRTFFLWKGRAFSFADADRRVDAIVRGLISRGVRPGQRVGVLMEGRPSYLSVVAAINRLGAIAVLYKPEHSGVQAIAHGRLDALIADPPNAAAAVHVWAGAGAGTGVRAETGGRAEGDKTTGEGLVLVLGGGPRAGLERPLPAAAFDLESVDPDSVELPAWYEPNPGRARDPAVSIVTSRPWAPAREARISNARWAVSAYGAAATCLLSSKDTVYCVLPLHHPAGMLVAVGGALVGRSRIALSRGFDTQGEWVARFWPEVRRYGVTVVFYAGEMWRELIAAPPSPAEGNHPLRLIAGSGMRADMWARIHARFGPISIREFYASTEGNLVLANIDGKPGALGRPLPGSNELAVVAYDFEADDFVRDGSGHARRCRGEEAGLLIAKIDATHPDARAAGLAGEGSGRRSLKGEAFQRDVFGGRETWFVTGDLVRRDGDGDFWYVDRTSHLIQGPHGWVASRGIEDALYAGLNSRVKMVVVYALERETLPEVLRDGLPESVVVATLVLADSDGFDSRPLSRQVARLRPEQRPRFVRLRSAVALTDGYRPLKTPLRAEGLDPEDHSEEDLGTLRWDDTRAAYLALDG